MRPAVSLSFIVVAVASAVLAGSAAGTSPPPSATTGKVVRFRGYDVTVSGTVNPRGSKTTVHFEFGESADYYSRTSKFVDVGSGDSPVSTSAMVSGFMPRRTFHYRIVASNSGGTTYGLDRSFTTPRPPVLSKLRISPHAFQPGPRGGSLAHGGGGTTIHFRLSAATTAKFQAEKRESGRLKGQTCMPATDATATGKRCTYFRWVSPFFLYYAAKKGENEFHFSGRVGYRALEPGVYRLWARPWGNYKFARADFAITSGSRTQG